MSEGRALIEKGSRSFDAAELLLARGDADFAASRTYYACFYVAEALLLSEGLTLSTHAGVIEEYGRLFAKTRLLPPRFHQLLNRSRARQSADYDTDFDLSSHDVREMIQEGRAFLDAARDYLGRENIQEDCPKNERD